MKFAIILREAGIYVPDFPKCSSHSIVLYDEKDRIISDQDIHFSQRLFHNNPVGKKRFSEFLKTLENQKIDSPINIQISESYIAVFYKTPKCKLFSRKPKNFLG